MHLNISVAQGSFRAFLESVLGAPSANKTFRVTFAEEGVDPVTKSPTQIYNERKHSLAYQQEAIVYIVLVLAVYSIFIMSLMIKFTRRSRVEEKEERMFQEFLTHSKRLFMQQEKRELAKRVSLQLVHLAHLGSKDKKDDQPRLDFMRFKHTKPILEIEESDEEVIAAQQAKSCRAVAGSLVPSIGCAYTPDSERSSLRSVYSRSGDYLSELGVALEHTRSQSLSIPHRVIPASRVHPHPVIREHMIVSRESSV